MPVVYTKEYTIHTVTQAVLPPITEIDECAITHEQFVSLLRAVDVTLHNVFAEERSMFVLTSTQKYANRIWFRKQSLTLSNDALPYLAKLFYELEVIRSSNPFVQIRYTKQSVSLYIDKVQTHEIIFPSNIADLPMASIVIDDIGESIPALQSFFSIPIPFTYAIWPFATETQKSASLIQKHSAPILIHMPMEPKRYPTMEPGNGALLLSLSKSMLERNIQAALEALPNAIGLNNHMGSAFTESNKALEIVLQYLKRQRKDFLILDSVTTDNSLLYTLAKRYFSPVARRSIFLDHIREPEVICSTLLNMENKAQKSKRIIAIGHPAPSTLEAFTLRSKAYTPHVLFLPLDVLVQFM